MADGTQSDGELTMNPCGIGPQTPQRLPEGRVVQQSAAVRRDRMIMAMLEAFPGPAIIVNDRRQIVVANQPFITACGYTTEESVVGKRPGDALGCVEARRGPDGCGSATACAHCGAGKNFELMEREKVERIHTECLISREVAGEIEGLEFSAGLSRLPDGWTLMALQDLSNEKRRQVLERCFFHDVMNSASGVQGLASLLEMEGHDHTGLLGFASQSLIDELQHHRMLLEAESGALQVAMADVDLRALAEEVAGLIGNNPVAQRRAITIVGSGQWRTDRVLLRRILVNLVKNACEAIYEGDSVTVKLGTYPHGALIVVENPGEMSAEAQAKIFKRSFSTKASSGRGIGSWSVRLLTERYLGGRVSCVSELGQTAFSVYLPAAT